MMGGVMFLVFGSRKMFNREAEEGSEGAAAAPDDWR